MQEKNDIQKNFIKQMKELERDLKKEEKQDKGAFTNTLYKRRFYGYHDIDAERAKAKAEKRKTTLKKVYTYLFLLIVAGSLIKSYNARLNENSMVDTFSYGEYEETIKYSDRILKSNSSDFDALLYKGKSLAALGSYNEAISYFEKAIEIDSNNDTPYVELGYNYYKLKEYDKALNNLNQALTMNPKNSEGYVWKGYCFVKLGRFDEALECMDLLEGLDPQNAHGYNIRGLTMSFNGSHKEAIQYYDKAISICENENERFEAAYMNKAWALYGQKAYSRCIEYCTSIKDYFPENYDIPYYIADCYIALGESEKAISAYQEAIAINPDDANLYANIGWEYYKLENYEMSSQYADKAEKISSENYSTKILRDSLEEVKKPDNERIVNFVKENYLYLNEVKNFNDKAEKFLALSEIDAEDIYYFLESVRKEDDPFTFFIFDEYYEQMLAEELNNQIEYQSLGGEYYYIKISLFTPNVAEEFRMVLEQIPNCEDQILVIDLRDNPGGLADPTNDILDILLPKCCTSYMIDRNGEIYSYYSDQSQVNFKHIYILVNSESASSAELLTLGLDTYLQNVTVIGEPTVGKGVAQSTFENIKKKYVIFLVSSYWNIKEKNISDSRIQPDIYLSSDDLQDYINVMKEHQLKLED